MLLRKAALTSSDNSGLRLPELQRVADAAAHLGRRGSAAGISAAQGLGNGPALALLRAASRQAAHLTLSQLLDAMTPAVQQPGCRWSHAGLLSSIAEAAAREATRDSSVRIGGNPAEPPSGALDSPQAMPPSAPELLASVLAALDALGWRPQPEAAAAGLLLSSGPPTAAVLAVLGSEAHHAIAPLQSSSAEPSGLAAEAGASTTHRSRGRSRSRTRSSSAVEAQQEEPKQAQAWRFGAAVDRAFVLCRWGLGGADTGSAALLGLLTHLSPLSASAAAQEVRALDAFESARLLWLLTEAVCPVQLGSGGSSTAELAASAAAPAVEAAAREAWAHVAPMLHADALRPHVLRLLPAPLLRLPALAVAGLALGETALEQIGSGLTAAWLSDLESAQPTAGDGGCGGGGGDSGEGGRRTRALHPSHVELVSDEAAALLLLRSRGVAQAPREPLPSWELAALLMVGHGPPAAEARTGWAAAPPVWAQRMPAAEAIKVRRMGALDAGTGFGWLPSIPEGRHLRWIT
jgi:hypothetical protein